MKEAEESNKPSKKGRFGKDELATENDDQFDADEANANQPVEPSLKKRNEDTQQGRTDISIAPLKIVNGNKKQIFDEEKMAETPPQHAHGNELGAEALIGVEVSFPTLPPCSINQGTDVFFPVAAEVHPQQVHAAEKRGDGSTNREASE